MISDLAGATDVRAAAPPRIECPIPPRISPHADAVQRWLADWVRGCGVALDAAARRRFDAGAFARYAGRLYPDADPADLRVLTSLFTWFFLLDDAADTARRPQPERLRGMLHGVLATLSGDEPGPQFGGPLRAMLLDAWREPRRRMPAPWRARFLDAVRQHLDGVLAEAENKARGRAPTVVEYVVLRRATSAAYVSHALTEFVAGRTLPDAVYHHPAVRAYRAAGNDLLSWFNDLLSLDRDLETAGGHNLVLALATERGMPLPAAVHGAVGMWRERMARLPDLRAAVPPGDPLLERHLDGVDRSVRATLDWSLESGRYRPPALVAGYLGAVAAERR